MIFLPACAWLCPVECSRGEDGGRSQWQSIHFSRARPCVYFSAPWGKKKSENEQAWGTRIFLHLFLFLIPDTSTWTSSDLLLKDEKIKGHMKQRWMALQESSDLWERLAEDSDFAAAHRCTSEPGGDGRKPPRRRQPQLLTHAVLC